MTQIFISEQLNSFEAFLKSMNASKFVLLADANSNGFCIPVLRRKIESLQLAHRVIIPQGELNKNLAIVELIWSELIDLQVDRNTILICVGGGVVCDLGGFVASTFKRGIRVVYIPTTLLAMVDACYGGKTGFDFASIKNLIGTFYHPEAIFMDTDFLQTLSHRTLVSGVAEMIKHALIADENSWNRMQTYVLNDFITTDALYKSLQIKQSLVDEDMLDVGIRMKLNFGHTVGHAIESSSLLTNTPLLHGEAIMLGMQVEIRLSEILFGFDVQVGKQFNILMMKFFPDLRFANDTNNILSFIMHDKKIKDGNIQMSLLKRVGDCEINVPVSLKLIRETLL